MNKESESKRNPQKASDTAGKPKKKIRFSMNTLKASRKFLSIVVIVAALIVGLLGFGIYAATYDDILPKVCVNDLNVGGMSREEAKEEIERAFGGEIKDRKITFECEGTSESFLLSDINTRIDSEKASEDAYAVGRSNGFFGKFFGFAASVFKGKNIPLSIDVDDAAFESLISRVASGNETLMTETGYELDGTTLVIVKGEPGEMVDRKKALDLLAEAVADTSVTKIELEIEYAEPKKVDPDEFYKELTAPAADAEYKLEDGNVIIIPHKPGITVAKKEIEKALSSPEKRYSLTVEVDEPKVTEDDLRSLLFRDIMGSYSSDFSSSTEARASNVRLTAQRINGYILMPGDVFSYDKTVGTRTVANGYKSAGVYVGNKVESGIGGGICQTSSTLYCAALKANLEIVERTSHSLPVSYVPAGMDATIAEGYIDLKLRNNTDYPIKIVATVNGRKLTCSVLGVKEAGMNVEIVNTTTGQLTPKTQRVTDAGIPKGYKKVTSTGKPGYTVSSKRIVTVNGKVVKEEKLTNSVYNATNGEEIVNPADKDTPAESLKPYNEEQYKKEQEEKKKAEEKAKNEQAVSQNEEVQGEQPASQPQTDASQPETSGAEVTVVDVSEAKTVDEF